MIAAKQYGVASRIIDLCTFDVTRNPLRCGDLFDAIVTDPPCACCLPDVMMIGFLLTLRARVYNLIYVADFAKDGVRAGAKRLGRKDTDRDRRIQKRIATSESEHLQSTAYVISVYSAST